MGWEERAYNRDDGSGGPKLIFPMPSKLTFAIIVACVVLFFLERLTGPIGEAIREYGSLRFDGGRAFTQPWRWITYQYLHGSGGHIFFNLLGIYFFLPPLERLWGWKRTLAFYTLGGVFAGATFGVMYLFSFGRVLIGASGSIFALLGALASIMPNMQILAMLVIPITMRTLVLLYTILFAFTVIGDRDSSDAAHLGGLAFGFFAVHFGSKMFRSLQWMRFGEMPRPYGSDDEPDRVSRPSWSSRRKSQRALKLAQAERDERERIDQILAKVSAQGMQSLNWLERRALKKATEHQRQRDAEMSRLRR